MRRFALFLIAWAVLGAASAAPVSADSEPWWRGEWRERHWGARCEVKLESKPGEFKREIKCPDGRGADWGRPRKREFRDGHCLVKAEATREVFKEEVKCDA